MENWISKAFDEASENADMTLAVNENVDEWLAEYMQDILKDISIKLSPKQNKKLEKVMSDKDLCDAFFFMCKTFAVHGYFWAIMDSDDDEED